MRRVRFVAVAALAVAAVACSDSGTAPTTPDGLRPSADISNASPNFNAGDNPERHIFELRGSAGVAAAAAKGGGGSGIFYHGGPVLQPGTNVSAVYWAAAPIYANGPAAGTTGAGTADASVIGHFMRSLGGSPYFGVNSTYTDGAGRAIVNAVNYQQFWANNSSVPADGATVTDAQMVAMLQAGFTGGQLTYAPGTLYLIFTAGKVNLGGGFGSQYCAYHTHGTVTINGVSQTVLYAAMPYDAAYLSGCAGITTSANGDLGADVEVNTLAHEIEETTTDMMGNAWFDRRGYENADKCAWTWGTTYTAANGMKANMNLGGKDFLVQTNWTNAGSGGCVLR
jgi:hypothetical protein